MIKVGEKVWLFDETRRIYKDYEGKKTLSPWYRGHFVEKFIVKETRQSWILGYDMSTNPKHGVKILKKNAPGLIFESEDAINKVCWVNANRCKISDSVKQCDDYDKLQRIEQILASSDTSN